MKLQHGFTLIELMVVVAIVALLASVAIPSYRQHVIKSNRAAAESFMLQAANREEQIMLDMRQYVTVANNASFPNTPAIAPPNTGINMTVPDNVSKFYNLDIAASGVTYTVTSTPVTTTIDPTCGTLKLDQTGAKTAIVAGATIAGCW